MPITQARMITLINAALDYQSGLEKSIAKIVSEIRAFRAGQHTAEEALSEISLFCGDRSFLMTDEPLAFVTVATERAHFASMMRRNEASKRWQEKQRRALGVRPREDSGTSVSLFLPATPRQYPVASYHQSPTAAQQQQQQSNLNYDDTEPAFESLSPDKFSIDTSDSTSVARIERASLSPHDIRRIEVEIAPAGHRPTVQAGATFEEDILVCQCGFEGTFEQWQEHLTQQENQS